MKLVFDQQLSVAEAARNLGIHPNLLRNWKRRFEVIGIDGKSYRTNQATIWRWREAYQHDFAARIDWSIAENYADANHPPRVALNGDTSIAPMRQTMRSGEQVVLDADGTSECP